MQRLLTSLQESAMQTSIKMGAAKVVSPTMFKAVKCSLVVVGALATIVGLDGMFASAHAASCSSCTCASLMQPSCLTEDAVPTASLFHKAVGTQFV